MEKNENILAEDLKLMRIGKRESEDEVGTDYWRKDITEFKHVSNIVLIHVCDENRSVRGSVVIKRERQDQMMITMISSPYSSSLISFL